MQHRWLGIVAFAGTAATATAAPAVHAPGFNGHHVARVATRAATTVADRDSLPPAAARRRCVAVDHMAGAIVIGDRAVELTMAGGSRWRMSFARECPALSFYQGFYYRRAQAGQLCAGRDAVIARSGGECPIAAIVALKPIRRR